MMRRMSKRLSSRALPASSAARPASSSAPGPRKGICGSDTVLLSDEDDVQDHDESERAAGEQAGRAPPDLVRLVRWVLRLAALEPPDEAAQLLLWLRLGEERDHHRDDEVDAEGDPRAPEA